MGSKAVLMLLCTMCVMYVCARCVYLCVRMCQMMLYVSMLLAIVRERARMTANSKTSFSFLLDW